MSENDEIDQKLNLIRGKLGELDAVYRELTTKGLGNSHHETLKEGYLMKAGKITESVLKYICKRQNITPVTKSRGGVIERRPVMLNDFIQTLKEHSILTDDILHHIDIIKKWRNHSAHDITSVLVMDHSIADSTIASVHDSFDYFIQWFFKVYLKDEVPQHISNSAVIPEKKSALSNSETEGELDKRESEEISVQEEIQVGSKNRINKSRRWLVILLLTSCVLLFASYITWNYTNNPDPSGKVDPTISGDEVYNLLTRYYKVCTTDTFNTRNYFAPKVAQYYNLINVTPEQIKYDPANRESKYIMPSIDLSSIKFMSEDAGISYWRFHLHYRTFGSGQHRYEVIDEKIEVGLDSYGKIVSIREAEL